LQSVLLRHSLGSVSHSFHAIAETRFCFRHASELFPHDLLAIFEFAFLGMNCAAKHFRKTFRLGQPLSPFPYAFLLINVLTECHFETKCHLSKDNSTTLVCLLFCEWKSSSSHEKFVISPLAST